MRHCGKRLLTLVVALWLVLSLSAPLALAQGEAESWTHVLLLGVDKLSYDKIRSDSIMLLSVSQAGQVKLTSFMRDMVVEIEGYGSQKLNRAYSYGGAPLAVYTVSKYFDVEISDYAVVNFSGLIEIIDALGGIELSITEAELAEINKASRKEDRLSTYSKRMLLNGNQALRFARIRIIDSDVMRVARHRQILEAIFSKIQSDPSLPRALALYRIWKQYVQTNISTSGLVGLCVNVLNSEGDIEQFRVPADGTFDCIFPDGVLSILPDYPKNVELLHAFLMGNDEKTG